MVDRNDIDALLIGSLYGELSSADEARLKAHLESHPADRTALDGLARTRDAVRASRIFDVQAEPPQSVSALLLQEAARRAPREGARESWFVRLRRSFLMSPAMAAAAMLVFVIGVAGTLYMRKGDHFAAPQIAAPEGSTEAAGNAAPPEGALGSAAPAAAAPATSPPAVAAVAEADKAAQDAVAAVDAARAKLAKDARRDADGSYRVGLADEGGRGADAVEQQKKSEVAQLPKPEPRPAPEPKRDEKAKVARQAGPGALLEVTTPRPAPKDLDDEARPQKLAVKGRAQAEEAKPSEAPMAAPAIAAAKPAAPATRAPEAAAPAPAAASATMGIARGAGAATGGGAAGVAGGAYGGEEKSVAEGGELAWAREQHTRLVGQVRAGHCTEAAGTAVALSSRAPGYYQQNVENDRSVKTCLPYINAERERAAERARARAATVRGNYEPAATAQKQAASKKAAPAKPAAADRAEPAKAAPATTQTK